MAKLTVEEARELAMRVAGATHSRRVYANAGPIWERTLGALTDQLRAHHQAGLGEISLALLGEGIAVCGVPIHAPPDAVVRFIKTMQQRDVEIVAFLPGVVPSEVETLLSYLSADAAEVAAVNAEQWLKARGADNVRIKHMKLTRGEGLSSFRDVFRRGVAGLGGEFKAAAARGVVNAGAIAELAGGLMDIVIEGSAPVATLLAMRDRQDYSTVHSVNVAMMATCQATALGLAPEEVQAIGMAALTHDIGMSRVPEGILQKTAPLTPAEQGLLASHTVEGARILMESKGAMGVPAIVSFAHHTLDPEALLATELVRIADTFDCIRTLRPFDDAEGMAGAASYMIHYLRNRFNSYLLERFTTICGIYKIGDVRRLTTGELARVVRVHQELALCPTVEILEPGQGGAPPGAVIDLTAPPAGVKPALMVPPLHPAFAQLDPQQIDDMG